MAEPRTAAEQAERTETIVTHPEALGEGEPDGDEDESLGSTDALDG